MIYDLAFWETHLATLSIEYNELSILWSSHIIATIAESFYYVNYRSSIITSKNPHIISVMKIYTGHWCFQKNYISKIVHFGIWIHALSCRQQKHQFMFSLWDRKNSENFSLLSELQISPWPYSQSNFSPLWSTVVH